jgi:lipopolysaccharide biosynthesis regulator YciM
LNRYAFVNLQKLYEDQQQWTEAARVREQIAAIDGNDSDRRNEDRQILGFLSNEVGSAQARSGDSAAAAKTFQEAIDVNGQIAPAYLNLGDVREQQGNLASAIEAWEKLVQMLPERAYLAFDRLERTYRALGTPRRFVELCHRLIARDPRDWRARLALSRHLAAAGHHGQAFDLLLDALPHNPHGLVIHQEAWHVLSALGLDPALVRRYVDLTRNAVFYLDPHVCLRCRYRSTELLWQCPQCHEWNTFVEERIAPAKNTAVAELTET